MQIDQYRVNMRIILSHIAREQLLEVRLHLVSDFPSSYLIELLSTGGLVNTETETRLPQGVPLDQSFYLAENQSFLVRAKNGDAFDVIRFMCIKQKIQKIPLEIHSGGIFIVRIDWSKKPRAYAGQKRSHWIS